MIEKLLDEAIKPFEALLTKQRCIVFLVSALFLSPGFFECINTLFSNPSIGEFFASLGRAYKEIEIATFFCLLAWVFYLSPRVIYFSSKFINTLILRKFQGSVERLIAFNAEDSDYFLRIYDEVNYYWKYEKERAEGMIRYRLEYTEIVSALSIVCVLFSILQGDNLFLSVSSFLLVFLYLFYASVENLRCYFKFIAPYKIALARFASMQE